MLCACSRAGADWRDNLARAGIDGARQGRSPARPQKPAKGCVSVCTGNAKRSHGPQSSEVEMSLEAKPIRNVYYAIDLIMKGKKFASFQPLIEVRSDATLFWTYALGGANAVLKHASVSKSIKDEFNKLIEYVDKLP
jgi:hypothetical protein